CCQVAPPSVDSSANGTAPGSVPAAEPTAGPFPIVPWPRATTRLPLTASTWLEPVARFTSCARVQLVMLADHQTSATQPPPTATSRPTMTYPAGPEVAATAETPPRSWVMFPPVTPQMSPSAEVSTTGPGAPTASQPAGPCVTLVSARRCGSAATSPSEETRVQAPTEVRRHTAG